MTHNEGSEVFIASLKWKGSLLLDCSSGHNYKLATAFVMRKSPTIRMTYIRAWLIFYMNNDAINIIQNLKGACSEVFGKLIFFKLRVDSGNMDPSDKYGPLTGFDMAREF